MIDNTKMHIIPIVCKMFNFTYVEVAVGCVDCTVYVLLWDSGSFLLVQSDFLSDFLANDRDERDDNLACFWDLCIEAK